MWSPNRPGNAHSLRARFAIGGLENAHDVAGCERVVPKQDQCVTRHEPVAGMSQAACKRGVKSFACVMGNYMASTFQSAQQRFDRTLVPVGIEDSNDWQLPLCRGLVRARQSLSGEWGSACFGKELVARPSSVAKARAHASAGHDDRRINDGVCAAHRTRLQSMVSPRSYSGTLLERRVTTRKRRRG